LISACVAEEDEDKVRRVADTLRSRGYKTCTGGLQPGEESGQSTYKGSSSDKKDGRKEGKKLSHFGSVGYAITSAAAVCLCVSVSILVCLCVFCFCMLVLLDRCTACICVSVGIRMCVCVCVSVHMC
jgi:hypothetical protein